MNNRNRLPSFLDSQNLPSAVGTILYVLIGGAFFLLAQTSNSIVVAAIGALLWPLTLALGCVVALMGAAPPFIVGITALAATLWLVPYFGIISWQRTRAAERSRFNNELRERQALEASRQELIRQIVNLSDETNSHNRSLDGFLRSASENLDVAQHEYADGVINPFWEAIEDTTRQLSSFEIAVTNIRDDVSRFRNLCKELGEVPCSINGAIDESTFRVATDLARRLRTSVREAQKNPTFATVYEQRRTTTAVYHGFSSFASAIQGMESRIVDSIKDLSSTFRSSMEDLQISQEQIASQFADHAEHLTGYLDSVENEIKSGHETQEKTHQLLQEYIEKRKR